MIPEDLKILLIEDNADDVAILKYYLATHCSSLMDIEVCPRLNEALHRLDREKPGIDVILLDLGLPDSNGFETFVHLYRQAPMIPIVILSGLDDEDLAIRAVREGAQDFLVKGRVNGELLLRSLRYSVERMKAKEALRQARDDLENRVRERTAELVAANQTLKEMVSKVTAAGDAVRKALRGIIQVISLIIEDRDPYTAGHQRGVADLARSIADVMGLPPDRIEGIRLAAIVHDLGKIAIPAEILAKPSSLTEVEMSMIRTHPRSGYEILKRVEFPWPIAQIVLQHHERINGSGYPQGLHGPDILLEAKILGVADVVDAMCSHRPYRPAIGIGKALAEITMNRGILYDPGVVDACLKYFEEKLAALPTAKKSYKHLISSQPGLPFAL
ncbi:MAG: HD domain-containing protein [Deltaproteobacteria bacterium]|nr:HD domain-containing protein [Deltaproteobacteria bacterium]